MKIKINKEVFFEHLNLLNITQKEFCRINGIFFETMDKVINDEIEYDYKLFKLISERLGVPYYDLIIVEFYD